MILNSNMIGLVEDKPRIFIAGDDRKITQDDLAHIEHELHIDYTPKINDKVKEASETIINTPKISLPKRKWIIDTKTSNESFLELRDDLKILGVDNNKFFLRLYDPDLQGVNPFLPNLPVELQIKIWFEVWINPWYFLREICRIPEDGKPIEIGGGSEFKIDRTSVACWYLFLNGIDHYESKPRQTGKTQDALAKQSYAFNWGCTSTQFLFFNKDFPQAKVNLYRLKCQREMLPAYLQMTHAYTDDGKIDKGINNVTTMRNPLNNNSIKCMTKATSVDIARSQGRGDTAAMHYMDEFDFWPYNETIMKAAAFSYARASENAVKNKSLHCRICTSTPGFASSRDGKAAIAFIDHCVKWKDKYLDMPINKFQAILKDTRSNHFVYVEHTWKQLKKTEEWYEKQCELVDYDENTIAREIDLKRTSGNELNPLKKEHQVYIQRNTTKAIYEIDYSKNLCPFYVYEKLRSSYPYIIIVDPAEGFGPEHDNSAIVGLNPYTLKTVIEYKTPYVSQLEMFEMLDKLLMEHIPKACVIVESNKGRELIAYFMRSMWKMNLWYDEDKLNSKIVEVSNEYGEAMKAAHERRAFGFDTTTKTRPRLFKVLENLAEEDIDTLCTEFVSKDVLGLIQKPNGKIEAGNGEHDDVIMAKLIGHYVYYNATNLEEFGIVKGAKEPDESDKVLSEVDKFNKLKELMPYLPQDVQEFMKAHKDKNPINEANKYYKEIEIQRSQRETLNSVQSMNRNGMSQRTTPQQSDALWSQFYGGLSDVYQNGNNGMQDSEFGQSNSFNIEDYL